MSDETGSSTRKIVYVRLLDEGTDVSRPTEAIDLGDGLLRLLPTPNYNPEDETWEFPPNSVVRAERRIAPSGEHFLAVKA
jgi:hypothetical protein